MITDYTDYLTPYEVADELCVSLTTVYNLLREKKLPGFKVGKVWRIPKDALERVIYGWEDIKNTANGMLPFAVFCSYNSYYPIK